MQQWQRCDRDLCFSFDSLDFCRTDYTCPFSFFSNIREVNSITKLIETETRTKSTDAIARHDSAFDIIEYLFVIHRQKEQYVLKPFAEAVWEKAFMASIPKKLEPVTQRKR